MFCIYNIYRICQTYIYLGWLLLTNMPTITVYLDAELYDYVKASPSAIIQKALKQSKEREEAAKNQ